MDPRIAKSNKLKLTWGLISLIGPTALIVIALIIYAVANYFLAQAAQPTGDSLFGSPSAGTTLVNITLYIIGVISFLTWLPGIVIGIILLATRK